MKYILCSRAHCPSQPLPLGFHRVPSGVCIYIPGYVYIPFSEIGYVKGMYLTKKVCKTVFTAMFPGYLKRQTCSECL